MDMLRLEPMLLYRKINSVRSARDFNVDDVFQLTNLMFEVADHPGIAQFRVGAVTVTVLDMAVTITFSSPFDDANYEVFIQQQANLATIVFPSNFTASGFRLNLSVGVEGTFSYFAVGRV